MTRCVDELVIIILPVLFAFYHFLYVKWYLSQLRTLDTDFSAH
jgi:hypothetical protein